MQDTEPRRPGRYAALAVAATVVVTAAVALVPSLRGTSEPALSGGQNAYRYAVAYDDAAAYEAGEPAVQECLRLPGLSEQVTAESLPPVHSGRAAGSQAAGRFERCAAAVPGTRVTVGLEGAPAGAEVCVLEGPEPTDCHELDAAAAARLQALLPTTAPEPADTAHCTAAGPVHALTVAAAGGPPVRYEVPQLCGPLTVAAPATR